ncbi:hypothetical protein [Variovorax rhizosphaerae]|uniref:Uncharacterized protein n=1 Tax=Variovorax rhizosphaerae TaxID=1836200 RepID=A0ABU8WDB8_9BURK
MPDRNDRVHGRVVHHDVELPVELRRDGHRLADLLAPADVGPHQRRLASPPAALMLPSPPVLRGALGNDELCAVAASTRAMPSPMPWPAPVSVTVSVTVTVTVTVTGATLPFESPATGCSLTP